MAEAAATGFSSYRIKFRREQFLELISIAKPRIIYKRKSIYIFAYDGFVMYSSECNNEDFQARGIKILETIEFSNTPWQK